MLFKKNKKGMELCMEKIILEQLINLSNKMDEIKIE